MPEIEKELRTTLERVVVELAEYQAGSYNERFLSRLERVKSVAGQLQFDDVVSKARSVAITFRKELEQSHRNKVKLSNENKALGKQLATERVEAKMKQATVREEERKAADRKVKSLEARMQERIDVLEEQLRARRNARQYAEFVGGFQLTYSGGRFTASFIR